MLTNLIVAGAALLALLHGGYAMPSWNMLESYSFEKFVKDFGHRWEPFSEEWKQRHDIFHKELSRVRDHNLKSNLPWKEGINKYSAMTVEEKQVFKGRNKGAAAAQKLKHQVPMNIDLKPVSDLPAAVDWREKNLVGPVKDQGHCGSCWAFASTAVIESHVAKESGLMMDLSVQQMTMCAPNPDHCGGKGKCEGSTAELAFDYVAGVDGMFSEYQIGYSAYTGVDSNCSSGLGSPAASITGFTALPENDYTSLMNAVATVGPVAVSVDASSWSAYEGGIFDGCNKTNPDVDHLVVLVGYGEENGQKYWIVKNSWSPAWGEKGYIRIARYDNEDQMCGTDITPTDGVVCEGDNEPVKVCGTCGMIYDASYPVGAAAYGDSSDRKP
jgi:cathepsin L